MIDLHSHILPEVDDGARNLEESLSMARMAVASGVTAMVATPHCAGDRRREVYEAWLLLREALEENRVPLQLFLGMEIYGTPATARMLRDGSLFTLNSSRYPLIDFSFQSDAYLETRILHDVCSAGFRPVVAHPERYLYIQEDPALLNRWFRMGCLMQINRGSILGRFGRDAQKLAVQLVERGFATVIASDAHTSRQRTPWMKDVNDLIRQGLSPQHAQLFLVQNPKKIIENEDVQSADPIWFE